jgi:CRP-like cAMP-binding protein
VLTIVEKVILLQNVDVFSEVSTEHLAHLAAIAEEYEEPQGARIYSESDPSDAMYIVLTGTVRLHRGDTQVTVAEAEMAFGTWSLFDDELRVVTATTLEHCRLLRIDKEDFIDLLADNVEITQGVLKAVVRRLRALAGRVGVGRG